MQIATRQKDPFGARSAPIPKLEYMLRGIKRQHSKRTGEESAPSDYAMLLWIKAVFESNGEFEDREMLWAACCICFSNLSESAR